MEKKPKEKKIKKENKTKEEAFKDAKENFKGTHGNPVVKRTSVQLLNPNSDIQHLKTVSLFSNFTDANLDKILSKMKIIKIKDKEYLIKQGDPGTQFFIIKKGRVDILVNDNYIRTMDEKEFLGERALLFNEPRSASAKANGDIEAYSLDKGDFESVIGKKLREFLINRCYLQDEKIQLNDLGYCDSLGKGSYGSVSLVKSKKEKNKSYYAIKDIPKAKVLYEGIASNLSLERKILLQIDHPFIVKLVKTLKDENNIYFLMEYLQGKELYDVIRDIGLLNKYQSQYYIGSLLLAVNYLHQRKIIYRDIKPENAMIVNNGLLKIVDFGTAKIIKNRTDTIIGTPQYMAPEIFLGEGYSFQVDYWSIGVCLYEFVCGVVPFGEEEEDPVQIYVCILNK
ncbi:MAG: cyclic nucleotide-binding serine/threonine-protein kinase [archaeon]|nr:cyclic nucleotide-binding serine/threonine-protein kinase [archaeon]